MFHWLSSLQPPKGFPVILQSHPSQCGLACIAMVSSFHGYLMNINALRHRYPNLPLALSLKDLIRFAKDLKLDSTGYQLSFDELSRLKAPAILHWNHNHFIVLVSIESHQLTIIDPAIGLLQLPLNDAKKAFTGYALTFRPNPAFQKGDGRLYHKPGTPPPIPSFSQRLLKKAQSLLGHYS